MDILYKKVFNNQYLNRYIYNFVQYGNDNNDFSQTYYKIKYSYNILDLKINELIRKKEHKLLGSAIDNYFRYVVGCSGIGKEDSYKYWYYVLNPTKYELRKLLKWNGLGYNRFELLFNEFKHVFELDKPRLVRASMVSGNFEIFKFLLDQGYPLNFKVSNINAESKKFNCFGNIDIFKVILENYKPFIINEQFIAFISSSIRQSVLPIRHLNFNYSSKTYNKEETDDWINNSTGSNQFQYYEIYKLLLDKSINQSVRLARNHIKPNDLSHAKAYIELMNKENLNDEKLIGPYSKVDTIMDQLRKNTNLILSITDYNILKYGFENLESLGTSWNLDHCKFEDFIIFHSVSKKYQNKNVYTFNVSNTNQDHIVIIEDLLYKCIQLGDYRPNSIEEFQFIKRNEKLNKLFFSSNVTMVLDCKCYRKNYLLNILQYVGNELCELDYFKFIIQYYFKDQIAQGDKDYFLEFVQSFCTSTYEILEWVFETYINRNEKAMAKISLLKFSDYELFKGDIRTLKLVDSLGGGILQPRNIGFVIDKGYIDMVIYEFEMNRISLPTATYLSYFYNKFNIFKYLIDQQPMESISSLPNFLALLKVGNINCIHPLFLGYWLHKTNIIGNFPTLTTNTTKDYLLKSIYINNEDYQFVSQKNKKGYDDFKIIQFNSIKVMDYLVSNNEIPFNKIFNSTTTVSKLIRLDSKKFIYLIDKYDGLSKLTIKQIGFIIKESILSTNYLILNYIANLKSNSSEFKHQFYLYFLLYSILLVNRKNHKFNSIGTSNSLNCKSLFKYYETIEDTTTFKDNFLNIINFNNNSQNLYLDNLYLNINQQTNSFNNVILNHLDLFIQQQHNNNNFYTFLLNLKNTINQ